MVDDTTTSDIGRKVASVRGIDWEWRTPLEDVVVLDVRTVYCPAGAVVEIGNGADGYWYGVENIRLYSEKRRSKCVA